MRRACILTVLIIGGVLSIVVAAQRGATPPQPPFELEKLKDNLYVLHGGCGCGNTTFFITDNGVVMVDTKTAGNGSQILTHLRSVTDKPITMIVNTHTHFDHTGSNAEFGAVEQIVAHENVKATLSQSACDPRANCGAFKGENAAFLPNTTFKDRRTLNVGKDQIDLYYFGPGHTNGDAWIVFPALRVGLMGDLFARKGLPVFFTAEGGSALAFADTVTKGVAGIKNVDTVITGHDIVVPWADAVRYAELQRDFKAHALAGLKAGRRVEEVANAYNAPERLKDFAIDRTRAQNMVQGIYDESRPR